MPFLDAPPGATGYADLPRPVIVVGPELPIPPGQLVTISRTPTAGAIPPAFRVEYGSSQAGQNRIHQLANGGLDVSLYPANLASGTLTLLYGTMADALACRAAHADVGVFTLADPNVPSASMRYVVAPGDGALQLAKADDDGQVWQLSILYQQVP